MVKVDCRNKIPREEIKKQYFSVQLAVNVPVLEYGMTVGWMSPMSLLLQSELSPTGRPISETVLSWMAAIPFFSGVIFAFIFAYIGDKCGRKLCILLMSGSLVISWGMLLCSTEDWVYILSRFFVGLVACPAYVISPMYTKEISDANIRGALVSLAIVAQTSGNLILYVIGDLLSYTAILWLALALPLLHMLLFTFMPESPSYLVKKDRIEDAINAMAWLRCREIDDPSVIDEINYLRKEQTKDEESSSLAWKAIFSDKILTKAFTIALVVSLAREVCGANPALNFAGFIFDMASKDSGASLTPNQQAMVLGAVQVVGSLLAVSVVENIGRKALLLIASLISGISMCGLATWFLIQSFSISAPSWIPITTLCLCIFCDAAGLQPISIVIINEIFSFKYRGTVSSIAMAASSFANGIQLLFFLPIANSVGAHAAFYFFGGVCLFQAIFTVLRVPETKQKTVDEIYVKLGRIKT